MRTNSLVRFIASSASNQARKIEKQTSFYNPVLSIPVPTGNQKYNKEECSKKKVKTNILESLKKSVGFGLR